MEVINFQDFMKQDYKKIRKVDYKVLSIIPLVSITSIFNAPPLIIQGYAVVLGLGMVMIIVSIIESILASKGHTELATSILEFFKFVMPLVYIAAVIYLFANNPLLKWI